ncbi:protein translocase subunit SecD [Actinomyces minihominis]|uniref:protein translocase subunit SecD n=1 Tax=Actinomyces minihominis TaxID=2002838 RepID=UPI000C081DD0|nr:protein translocase subunit SecD [Actinomyces minihominis]
MATKTNRPGRTLLSLLIAVAVAVGALVVGHFTQGAGFTPKLALDLEGGTQVILTPKLEAGSESRAVTAEDMNEAIAIIRQRVDASGVAEAEISTLGSNNIVVSIPGETDESILNLVRTSATMRFRPVLQVLSPTALDTSQIPQSETELAAMTAEELADTLADINGDGIISDEVEGTPENNSDTAWVTEALTRDALLLDCTDPANLAGEITDDPAKGMVACSVEGDTKYILGPVDIEGTHLKSASAGMETNAAGQTTGQYAISLELDGEGTKLFTEASNRLYNFSATDPTRNRFAVVLDGNVIIAPSMNVPITDGRASITGNFTAAEAMDLANQLQFGSLPLNFEVQSEQQISATLGVDHLEKGLWAGLIGLILVVLYMAWQYRGLALLSAGSLVVAAGLTYLIITLLSWTMGYRLSLPGVAGLIIAVGITADSFIVYFERVRDEVRDGRPLDLAVEEGWSRAKRTLVISDMVNLVAAGVLYVLAVGGVQGFAFTLGITTIVDLIVVFLFTHPMMSLLVRTKFWGGGHRLSGLDPQHLGATNAATYRGRLNLGSEGRTKPRGGASEATTGSNAPAAQDDNGKQLSLSERRRLAAVSQTNEADAGESSND